MHHYGAGTHVGNIRSNNEDNYVCDAERELWIVADGMGGLGFGEIASAIATYTVTTMIRKSHGVNQAIESAHAKIKEYAETDGKGTNMGTTLVLLLSQGSLYNIFWVGDSRAYLLDTETFKQVTVDHSLVQSLIDSGEITAEEAETDPRKNAVTRALGVQELETVRADSLSDKWKPGQKILLCSDGLTDCVSKDNIEIILRSEGTDQQLTDRLIEAALAGGGKDNVTVIIVSANQRVVQKDSDTHVPLDFKDDTDSPTLTGQWADHNQDQTNATMESDNKSYTQSAQLELAIVQTPETQRSPTVSKSDGGSLNLVKRLNSIKGLDWLKGSIAAAASISLIYLMASPSDQTAEPIRKPEAFVQQEDPYSHLAHDFPEIDLPRAGKIIQVGLYSHLNGAESRQMTLSHLGLEAYIQKRSTIHGLQYAVMLGPLSLESHEATIATLNSNKLNYFHQPPRGS